MKLIRLYLSYRSFNIIWRRICMRDVVYNVVKDELNWKERIIARIFTNTFNKVYNIGRINSINSILK